MSRDDLVPYSTVIAIDPGATTGRVLMPVPEPAKMGTAARWRECVLPVTEVHQETVEEVRIWGRHSGHVLADPERGIYGDRHVLVEDFTWAAQSEPERATLRQIGALEEIFDNRGFTVHRIPRTTVKRWLGCGGKGAGSGDSRVRKAILGVYGPNAFAKHQCKRIRNKRHPDSCTMCQGTGFAFTGALADFKGSPHAVQALGLAVAWLRRPGLCPCPSCEAARPPLVSVILDIVRATPGGATKAGLLRDLWATGLDITATRLGHLLAPPRGATKGEQTGVPGVVRLRQKLFAIDS
jgi:hypothetical protein